MSVPQEYSLFKRSNGIYYILYVENGRRRWKSTGCTRKVDALKKLSDFTTLSEPRSNTISTSRFSHEFPSEEQRATEETRIDAFTEDFLTYAEGVYSSKTIEVYRSALRSFLKFVGNLPLTSLTSKDLDLYSAEKLRSISPVSVNIKMRTLKAAMNVAVRWGLLEKNPFKGSPLIRVPERSPSYFTKEEFETLVSNIKEQWLKEIVVFAVLTGLRRGEIMNLKWEQVDMNKRQIQVRNTPTFRAKHGKQRVVPLSDAAHCLLNAKSRKVIGEYVFTLNGRKIMEDWPSQKLKKYVYELHFKNDKLHFHSLRHTFASWLVQDGAPLYEVQKLLGHSNIMVTQVYSHLQPEHLHKTVNRISFSIDEN